MKKLLAFSVSIVLLGSILAACTRGTGGAPTTIATTTALTTATRNAVTYGPEEQEAIDAANAKLADRLKVSASSITVVSIQPVNWPDTSLGFPEPGRMYAQVIVPGFKIILSSGGAQYEYHTGKLGGVLTVATK
ncbi:MAG: hypothetical protein HYX90_11835 [Chloroflexi bacterium]|nr:hypothetical protein [Chloroflexota bacterium]